MNKWRLELGTCPLGGRTAWLAVKLQLEVSRYWHIRQRPQSDAAISQQLIPTSIRPGEAAQHPLAPRKTASSTRHTLIADLRSSAFPFTVASSNLRAWKSPPANSPCFNAADECTAALHSSLCPTKYCFGCANPCVSPSAAGRLRRPESSLDKAS